MCVCVCVCVCVRACMRACVRVIDCVSLTGCLGWKYINKRKYNRHNNSKKKLIVMITIIIKGINNTNLSMGGEESDK